MPAFMRQNSQSAPGSQAGQPALRKEDPGQAYQDTAQFRSNKPLLSACNSELQVQSPPKFLNPHTKGGTEAEKPGNLWTEGRGGPAPECPEARGLGCLVLPQLHRKGEGPTGGSVVSY